MNKEAVRYLHTVLHLKTQQITGRFTAGIQRKMGWPPLPAPPAQLRESLEPCHPFLQHEPWNTRKKLLGGQFCFLHENRELAWPPRWKADDVPALWQFHLHYFNYLHLLRPDEQEAICRAWIKAHPEGSQPAWHPYPTSRRIISWCKTGFEAPDLLKSLYRQAAYLYRHLETHLLGNHLLENACALIFAGTFFGEQGEAPSWLAQGLQIYREQTPEQILPDGGHFERSPMYHALMLEGYLDALNLLSATHPDRPMLEATARRMTGFLQAVTHPNGRLALFNDATQETAPPTAQLVPYAQSLLGEVAEPQAAYPDTGYFVHETDALHLVIDGGAIGPDYLPAHAHADLFSYELSMGGVPFVVDSGVFSYESGPMRDYVRSTPAHNTVCVDNTNQAECWSSFRVARRFSPRDVAFERKPTGCRFSGRFDGYATLIGDGIQHRRTLQMIDREERLVITDHVEGRGRHDVRSYIHLHPEVEIQRDDDNWLLHRGDVQCAVQVNADVEVREGWYCPEFGKRIKNDVLVLGEEHQLPVQLKYVIQVS